MIIKLLSKSLYFTLCFIVFNSIHLWSQEIAINEILASNKTNIQDEDGDYEDWIEIYNYGETAINLEGFGLTDDTEEPFKWIFPTKVIEAKQFLIVWASKKEKTTDGGTLHADFKMSADGETITLTNKEGVTLSTVPSTPLESDISYGRKPDGIGEFSFFYTPTPLASNNGTEVSEIIEPPTFSHSAGLHYNSFNLSLTSSNSNATIVYTTDGSEPDINNISGTTYNYKNDYPYNIGESEGDMLFENYTSKIYNNPIPITDRSTEPNKVASKSTTQENRYNVPNVRKAFIVKARIYVNGIASEVKAKTFFVWNDGSPYNIPVVSLQVQENYLFDYEDGIYTPGIDFDTWRKENPENNQAYRPNFNNYWRSGRNWEYPANIQLFEKTTLKSVENLNGGLRIHGNNSRAEAIKNLRLYARSEYDTDNEFEHNLFTKEIPNATIPNNNIYKRIKLRGNGSGGPVAYDVAFNRVMQPVFDGIARIEPAVHFINGEYWGLTTIRDHFDNDHYALNFDLDADNIIQISCALGNQCELDEGESSDYDSYISMRDFIIDNDMSDESKYLEATNMLDIHSFINHLAIYFFSGDNGYERKFWKVRTPENNTFGDGKWRLSNQDFEAALKTDTNWLESIADINNSPNLAFFGNLLENNDFKEQFINRYSDLLNTIFSKKNFTEVVENTFAEVAPYLNEDQERYPKNSFYENTDKENLLAWADTWPEVQRTRIKDYFNLAATHHVTLNVSNNKAGFIKVNSIDINSLTPGVNTNPYPWPGTYFDGVPITVEAIPLPGYVFTNWSGNKNSSENILNISLEDDLNIQANFEKIPEYSQLIYFWYMDQNIENDTPLTSLDATYTRNNTTANIQFSSALAGYPFSKTDPNFGKATWERKNDPTPLNYKEAANSNKPYSEFTMRGVKINQPFKADGLENTLILNIPTTNVKNIKLSFDIYSDGAAEKLLVDYWENDSWSTQHLSSTTYNIPNQYETKHIDFSNVDAANNSPNFKIRLRFDGTDMTIDKDKEVLLNNIAIEGVEENLSAITIEESSISVFPNPTDGVIKITSNETINKIIVYNIYGQEIQQYHPKSTNYQVQLDNEEPGLYIVKLYSKNSHKAFKILKN